jgi:hypothetical protein
MNRPLAASSHRGIAAARMDQVLQPVSKQLIAHGRPLASGHSFSLLSRGGVGMRFARRCYPCRGQTIKFGGSVEPDLGQLQVARTDSAVVRFARPLEAFLGQSPILGGRFHFRDASQRANFAPNCTSRA